MATMISSDTAWQPVKIGAGGWVTGMDIAPDGTMVARTDTYGAYIWNGTSWVQLVTPNSMPAGVTSAAGVCEIRIAPSDSNLIYMEMGSGIYKSVDKGAHWTQTGFPPASLNANGANRMDGEKMAVDPNNPDIVFAGTQQNGLYVTHDGGTTWQQISAVPRGADAGTSSDPSLTGIVFDTSAGTTNGGTRVVYVGTVGSGVYQSSDGGSTWTALSGGPKDVAHAAVGSDGTYYAVGNTDHDLWKYAGGTWTELITSGDVHAISVDPFDPTHIIATRDSGNIQESHNGGASWSGWDWSQQLDSGSDVPWLENSGGYMSSGGVVFDPLVKGRLWQSAGVGVWSADLPGTLTSNSALTWHAHSAGIEQLVANDIIAPAGDNPLFASWDRAFFEVTDPNSYATSYSGGSFSMGWSLDYASSNSRFVVGISDWYGTENSGFSTDGGHSWQKFASMPSFAGSAVGGSVAASSPTNIIWAPAGGYAPAYTLDGGATWKTISLPGKTTSWSDFHQGYWLDRTTITADRVQPNTFYLYDAASGVYTTQDGGASWSKVFSGEITSYSKYNAKIEAVPGHAGELFFTAGPQSGADLAFMHSTDGGATWQAVTGVHGVSTFGYGAPATAGGPASIYMVGSVGAEFGVWYSTDDGQHWTEVGRYPEGSLDSIRTISGDMDQFGSVYVGFAGSGYAHLTLDGSTGTPGNDVLIGTPGLPGADALVGGPGDDTYYVDNTGDVVYENAAEGTDTVNSTISYALRSNVEILNLTGTGKLTGKGNDLANVIHGNDGSDRLYGYGGDDTLVGGAGRDIIDGGSGNDTMSGGAGNDVYVVDSSSDTVIENAGGGTDFVRASVTYTLGDNVERLYQSGSADINATGNALQNLLVGNGGANHLSGMDGNDHLYGGAGHDRLDGGAGNDYLEGGAGQDLLIGGAGEDYFVFRDGDTGATAATADEIQDFAMGDRLDFAPIDSNTKLNGNQAFTFIGTHGFDGVAGELRYELIAGDTYLSGDTDGDGSADFMVRLDGLHAITTTDLLL